MANTNPRVHPGGLLRGLVRATINAYRLGRHEQHEDTRLWMAGLGLFLIVPGPLLGLALLLGASMHGKWREQSEEGR